LVLELNPPHHGHKYFIDKAKDLVKPDYTIAVISTNFTMRGDISVINKFDKTRLCLDLGIDIVLELPYIACVASADYFCKNAITLLNAFGVTDVAFGAELDNLEDLRKLKDYYNSEIFNLALKEAMDSGMSYSSACNKALLSMTKDLNLIENFSMPNNTLAIQYINEIDRINEEEHKKIAITVIKRVDNNYFDKEVTEGFASATAIRELMKENRDFSPYVIDSGYQFIDYREAYNQLFTIIKSAFILKNSIEDLHRFLGVKEGIENRIDNLCEVSNSYDELVENTCTKRYSASYIRRVLLHIVLRVPSIEQKVTNYRVLGFNKNGQDYISELEKDVKSKIITSFKSIVDDETYFELKATKLYGLLTGNDKLFLQEYQIPIKK
ncbi:MAG: nucleotidyltransferase family protein, partial [Bacilli bacterium]|nr:nucleotidyltransferase family protein [Bacilli bacterium]